MCSQINFLSLLKNIKKKGWSHSSHAGSFGFWVDLEGHMGFNGLIASLSLNHSKHGQDLGSSES